MGGLLRRGWSRRIYRWLTTSARDHRNRVDDVGSNLQAARRARNEVQQVNDFFHAAGKGMSRAATVEGITLQGEDEGVAWSFLLLPAIFVVGLLTFISQYRRGERLTQQLAAEAAWQQQLQETEKKNAAAEAALLTAQVESGEMNTAMSEVAEEDALVAQLERNLAFIHEHMKKEAP